MQMKREQRFNPMMKKQKIDSVKKTDGFSISLFCYSPYKKFRVLLIDIY